MFFFIEGTLYWSRHFHEIHFHINMTVLHPYLWLFKISYTVSLINFCIIHKKDTKKGLENQPIRQHKDKVMTKLTAKRIRPKPNGVCCFRKSMLETKTKPIPITWLKNQEKLCWLLSLSHANQTKPIPMPLGVKYWNEAQTKPEYQNREKDKKMGKFHFTNGLSGLF